jgi:putative transposase
MGRADAYLISESLFRMLKYYPQWPRDGFASLEAARFG